MDVVLILELFKKLLAWEKHGLFPKEMGLEGCWGIRQV